MCKTPFKKSFTKGSITQYVLRGPDVSQKLTKEQGTKPTALDDPRLYTEQEHVSATTCYIDTRPSDFARPQPVFTKHEFTPPYILKMQMAFWCICKLVSKQHLT